MVNPKLMEAWFDLMVEARKGTKEAQEAFQALSKASDDPEALSRWMAKFMPAAMASSGGLKPEAVEEWLEESWRMMGVVPRSRYLELLEKNDQLQRRLEKAEDTVKKLRSTLSERGQQSEETQKMFDLWNSMVEDTLKAQTEWMQGWTAAHKPDEGPDEGQTDPSTDLQQK